MTTTNQTPEPTVEEIREARAKIPDPPYFVSFDEAHDCPDHADSGLAMVDTGRADDWPIARLCEWHSAKFIANAPRYIDFLLAENDKLKEENERLRRGNRIDD